MVCLYSTQRDLNFWSVTSNKDFICRFVLCMCVRIIWNEWMNFKTEHEAVKWFVGQTFWVTEWIWCWVSRCYDPLRASSLFVGLLFNVIPVSQALFPQAEKTFLNCRNIYNSHISDCLNNNKVVKFVSLFKCFLFRDSQVWSLFNKTWIM